MEILQILFINTHCFGARPFCASLCMPLDWIDFHLRHGQRWQLSWYMQRGGLQRCVSRIFVLYLLFNARRFRLCGDKANWHSAGQTVARCYILWTGVFRRNYYFGMGVGVFSISLCTHQYYCGHSPQVHAGQNHSSPLLARSPHHLTTSLTTRFSWLLVSLVHNDLPLMYYHPRFVFVLHM